MKILLSLILSFILLNCEVRVPESNAQGESIGYFGHRYLSQRFVIDEMTYLFVYSKNETTQTGYSITTINLTKDRLEVEKLKQEILWLTTKNCKK